MFKDMAAVVDDNDLDDGFIQQALAFAAFHDAHLTFVTVSPSIPPDYSMLPDLSYFDKADPAERTEAKKQRLVALSADSRAEVRTLGDDPEFVPDALSVRARYVDLVLFGAPDAYVNTRFRRRAAEAIVLASGRPVLPVPTRMTPRKWDHIVLGWNASREATRALEYAIAWSEPGAGIDIALVDHAEGEVSARRLRAQLEHGRQARGDA